MKKMHILLLAATGLLLGGCSSQLPKMETKPAETSMAPIQTPTAPAQKSAQTITAGNKTGYFGSYSIIVPDGWTSKEEKDASLNSNTLTITKGAYSLTISQAGGGAADCVFPGDKNDDEMAAGFSSFTAIKAGSTGLEYARGVSGSPDNTQYLVCEKAEKNYRFPTEFGYISYTVPQTQDQSILLEMDTMVASLGKK